MKIQQVVETCIFRDLEERNSHHLQSEERATRFVVSPSQLLDHVTENDYGKQPSEVSVTTVPEKKLGADKRVGKSDQHDENFQNPENIQSDRSQVNHQWSTQMSNKKLSCS